MSSVSLIGNSFQACSSPRELLQKELASEVAAGTISSTDQTALSSALDDIDSSLKSERSSGAGQSRPPSPDEMKSKIDDLIAGEVSDGKLTSDQAEELKNNLGASPPVGTETVCARLPAEGSGRPTFGGM
jgi:hypothetical protein